MCSSIVWLPYEDYNDECKCRRRRQKNNQKNEKWNILGNKFLYHGSYYFVIMLKDEKFTKMGKPSPPSQNKVLKMRFSHFSWMIFRICVSMAFDRWQICVFNGNELRFVIFIACFVIGTYIYGNTHHWVYFPQFRICICHILTIFPSFSHSFHSIPYTHIRSSADAAGKT